MQFLDFLTAAELYVNQFDSWVVGRFNRSQIGASPWETVS
jgi:hypothetical protein